MLYNFDKLDIKFSRYQDPEPGKMLISSPILKDRNFKKAVILICEVNENGIFGVILNKTLQISLADVLLEDNEKSSLAEDSLSSHLPPSDWGDESNRISSLNSPLYLGGPVKENSLNFIHNQIGEIEGSRYISENIAWGGRFRDLEERVKKNDLEEVNYKFFIGYSGWQHGQLESEIKEKIWIVSEMNKDIIFGNDDRQIWDKAIMGLEKKYHLLLKYPDDPNLN